MHDSFDECALLTPVGRQICLVLRLAHLVCLAPCHEFASGVQSVPIHEFFHVTRQLFRESYTCILHLHAVLINIAKYGNFNKCIKGENRGGGIVNNLLWFV